MNPIQRLKSTNLIVNQVMCEILTQFQQILHEKQVQKRFPQFTHKYFTQLLHQKIHQFTPNYYYLQPKRIFEQKLQSIIKIQVDNLCPQQLQNQQTNLPIKQLHDLSQIGSKRLNITNRSSFIKRKISSIQSSMMRGQIHNNSSLNKDKQKQNNFKSLIQNQQDHDDRQIQHLRHIYQLKYKQKQKQQKQKQQKQKHYQQRIQNFKKQFDNGIANEVQNNNNKQSTSDNIKKKFTFDYAGQTLQAEHNIDQKLVCYSMKYGLKTITKTSRTNKNKSIINYTQQILYSNRTSRSKQIKQSKQVINLHSTVQIPQFSSQYRTSIFQTDPVKLKINEFKRLYGKKFSRYDKNSMTIDLSLNKQHKQTEQNFFNEKKHLKDQKNINKNAAFSISKYSPRKLALPKLQGKYKVLDHYNYDDSV